VSAAGFTIVDGEHVPFLGEAAGVIECSLKERFEVGDHDLFVGECLVTYASKDFDTWKFKDYSPLLSLGSFYDGKKKRKFLSLKKGVIDTLCPAGEQVSERKRIIQKIKAVAERMNRESGEPVKLSKVANRVAEYLDIDSIDAKLIAEQLMREGSISAVKD
jgi:hypothetical protein